MLIFMTAELQIRQDEVNSAATENNPVRGCTSQHAGASGHRVEHLRRSVTVGNRVLLICKP
jgi:hypothetical protein